MTTPIKGPGIFLAQFLGDKPPFDNLPNITAWAKGLGYKYVQIPAWDSRVIDIRQAAESKTYCDELRGACNGLHISELATHLFGQLVAVHPVYDESFDVFAHENVRGDPKARTAWAVEQMKLAIKASYNLGLTVSPSFSGALLWPYLYPWPQRPEGLVKEGFRELAERWTPIFDFAHHNHVQIAFELHPGEDLHDGATFERFRQAAGGHPSIAINYDPSHFILQCMDYLGFIRCYGEFIRAFHVKDAEFNPSSHAGVYAGYLPWKERPGRFRSLGDGQVDFQQVFAQLAAQGYSGPAVLEWECCLKSARQGAAEGAPFIASLLGGPAFQKSNIIEPPEWAFDDFAGDGKDDIGKIRRMLGLAVEATAV